MDAFHCCIKKSTNETLMDSVWKAPQGTYGNALHPTCSKHDSAQYLMLIEMNIIVLIPESKYICELGLLVQYEDTGQINYYLVAGAEATETTDQFIVGTVCTPCSLETSMTLLCRRLQSYPSRITDVRPGSWRSTTSMSLQAHGWDRWMQSTIPYFR